MEDNNFFKTVNSKPQKSKSKIGFTKGILLPFMSGILGTILVIYLLINIPEFKEKFLDFLNLTTYTSSSKKEASQNDSTKNDDTIAPVINSNLISLEDYSNTSIYAANKVLPSIVGITVEYTINSPYYGYSLQSSSTATGSGVIISEDGYILTNNHVINSSSSYYQITQANKITVNLYNDETPYEAKIIGSDEATDLAVIKIDKNNLHVAELGNSDNIKIGEFAMAVGNPLGMTSSVSAGIISAINRTITAEGKNYSVIQTDAAINSGNSGGALINSKGEVIGINTLKLSGTGVEGIGFAIPINSTKSISKELIDNGKVLRPYIGISGRDINEATAKQYKLVPGVYVVTVEAFSAAEKAGIQPYDIITQVNGKDISSIDELNEIKNSHKIGDSLDLKIFRNNEYLEVKITLSEQP